MADVHCAHDRMVRLDEIRPNPRNPNLHPREQIELLAKIIASQGWRSPITVSMRSGMIVRGHGRYAAARLLGCETVPVDYQDYKSEAEEWQDLLADNRIAELSHVDETILREILLAVDVDVALTGYDEGFVKTLLERDEIEEVKQAIMSEEEYREARNTADHIIDSLTEKVRRLAETEPRRLNDAVAVIVQKGRGNQVLFLADPNAADVITELQRYIDAGEHSPLESLMEALIP